MFTGYLPTLHSTDTENDDSVIIARNMNTSAMFPVMQVFDIGDNLFTGSIPNVTLFGDTLQVLYLNQNSFTGTIPPWIFIGTSLFSVIMSSNCLSGTLPESMCYNVNGTLSELVLDGLHSASSCQQRAFPTIKNSGIVMYSGVHGTLPSCIFQIPSLTKLHIGGNALHGTLANVPYTTSLIEFVATTNEFTGEVPSSLWQSNVNVLDLSFNRLRGTLPSDMLPALRAENASLKLRVNQLSGDIPSILSNLSDINILEGNMFSCDFTRSQLPSHDPKESTYNCGSNATNDSFIVFLLASALMGCLIWWINPVLLDIFTSIQTIKDSVGNCKLFTHSLPYIEQVTCMILLFVVLSAMIAYGVLSIYYSTYSHSYIWTVCGIFLQGPVATVVLMLLLTTVLVLLTWMIPVTNQTKTHYHNGDIHGKRYFLSVVIVIVNIVVVTTINGLYVAAVRSDYDSSIMITISFAMSVFKLVWNYILINGSFNKRIEELELVLTKEALSLLCLFNNLIAPFLAESLFSSDCFLYVFSEAPKLLLDYTSYSCYETVVNGGSYTVCNINAETYKQTTKQVTFSVIPPFHYSYQCSFALLSDYVYVFVFRYVLSCFVEPVGLMLFKVLYCHPKIPPRVKALVIVMVPPIWRPSLIAFERSTLDTTQLDREACLQSTENYLSISGNDVNHRSLLSQKYGCQLLVDLSLLIAFGSLCPPLAFVIACSILKDTWEIRLALGKFKISVTQAEALSVDVNSYKDRLIRVYEHVQSDLSSVDMILWHGLWYSMNVAVIIWAFVLFDTLSALNGINSGIAVAVVMLCLPTALFVVRRVWNWKRSAIENVDGDIALKEIVENPITAQ